MKYDGRNQANFYFLYSLAQIGDRNRVEFNRFYSISATNLPSNCRQALPTKHELNADTIIGTNLLAIFHRTCYQFAGVYPRDLSSYLALNIQIFNPP